MEYHIALAPELGLDPADFVAAWNEAPQCRALAEARVDKVTRQYGPELIAATMAILGGISLNIVSDALYDLIKMTLARRGVQRTTEIIQLDQPDGSRLLVIKITDSY